MRSTAGSAVTSFALNDVLDRWTPEPEVVHGVVEAGPVAALADLLGVPAPTAGQALRMMWHEVALRVPVAADRRGPDGHPAVSGLVPPVLDRQRMFGGGRLHLHEPLRVGDQVTRIADVTTARLVDARSGKLLLVTERHRWLRGDALCLEEERDLVYRSILPTRTTPNGAQASGSLSDLTFTPTPQILRDYSRLTLNGHRIHHDRDYATRIEGHADLVVHGPLTALVAAEAVHRSAGVDVGAFEFRLTAPAYVDREIAVGTTGSTGAGERTFAVTAYSGAVACLRATATFW